MPRLAPFLIVLCSCAPISEDSTPVPLEKPQPSFNPPSFEALEEVNAARIARGLKPFQRDKGLTQGAILAASFRARHGISGHTQNDFSFLPQGTTARASGCGALDDSWGWKTCCYLEKWTYAGAAWSRGKDGLRYMHLFVK